MNVVALVPSALELAESLRRKGRWTKAANILKHLLSAPEWAREIGAQAHLSLARTHMARGDFGSARRHLRQAVRQDPGLAEAWHLLAEVEQIVRPRALPHVIGYLRRAVAADPDEVTYRRHLADAYRRAGYNLRAARCLSASWRRNRTDFALTWDYAEALVAAGERDRARRVVLRYCFLTGDPRGRVLYRQVRQWENVLAHRRESAWGAYAG